MEIATDLQTALQAASDLAVEARHQWITPEHLLLAMLMRRTPIPEQRRSGVAELEVALREYIGNVPPSSDFDKSQVEPDERLQRVMQRAILGQAIQHYPKVTDRTVAAMLLDPKASPIALVKNGKVNDV